MTSTAKEDMGQSSSSASDSSRNQPPQAGPPEAEEDSRCPICLGHVRIPVYVAYCMHKFCLRCIWQWATARATCPVCRQPIEKMVHSVQGDRGYRGRPIGLRAHLQRRVARERDLQPVSPVTLTVMQVLHDPEQYYGRSRPMNRERAQRQEESPGPPTPILSRLLQSHTSRPQ